MTDFHKEPYDDPFRFLELKATQVRKLLLGERPTLIPVLPPEGEGLMDKDNSIEAEDEFIDPFITEPFAKLDDILEVINKRACAVEIYQLLPCMGNEGQA